MATTLKNEYGARLCTPLVEMVPIHPIGRGGDESGGELVGTHRVEVGYIEGSFGVEICGGHGRSIVGVKPRGQARLWARVVMGHKG